MNGYKVIDCKGGNLTEDNIHGIFNAIDTTDKPLVISNYKVGESDTIGKPFYLGMPVYHTYDADHYAYNFSIGILNGQTITLVIIDNDDVLFDIS